MTVTHRNCRRRSRGAESRNSYSYISSQMIFGRHTLTAAWDQLKSLLIYLTIRFAPADLLETFASTSLHWLVCVPIPEIDFFSARKAFSALLNEWGFIVTSHNSPMSEETGDNSRLSEGIQRILRHQRVDGTPAAALGNASSFQAPRGSYSDEGSAASLQDACPTLAEPHSGSQGNISSVSGRGAIRSCSKSSSSSVIEPPASTPHESNLKRSPTLVSKVPPRKTIPLTGKNVHLLLARDRSG